MKRSYIDKLAIKREALISRTADILALDTAGAEAALKTERRQSLRLNPLKADSAMTLRTLEGLGWTGTPVSWMGDGFTIETGFEAIRDSHLTNEGCVMIQNAASWLPVLALDPQADERILDVCAAPGGKTAHIAAITRNKAFITANDNSRTRHAKLRATCNRMGADITAFTMFDAQNLTRKLEGSTFNKILLDAPCSGEGLMHLDDDRAFATWSVAQIKRLNGLQRRLILQAWRLLEPGGTLVYSTCTMAPEENEAVISYLLRTRSDAALDPIDLDLPNRTKPVDQWNGKQFAPETSQCLRLKPSQDIEAFFVCKLIKRSR